MKWTTFLKLIFFVLIIFVGITVINLNAGNSFIIANLRVDLPEIYNARDYRVQLMATKLPNFPLKQPKLTGYEQMSKLSILY